MLSSLLSLLRWPPGLFDLSLPPFPPLEKLSFLGYPSPGSALTPVHLSSVLEARFQCEAGQCVNATILPLPTPLSMTVDLVYHK